ncbi:hypothetical protein FB451DRAFT_1190185 [Mycena latifolia]|nr:hypothetical protein FB451DRAFT_1190185 [Mycena latifolia]
MADRRPRHRQAVINLLSQCADGLLLVAEMWQVLELPMLGLQRHWVHHWHCKLFPFNTPSRHCEYHPITVSTGHETFIANAQPFLHTKHQVSFRACALLLVALNFIFVNLPGNLLGGQTIPITLSTNFSRLELKDKFKIHPICYLCHKIFEPDAPNNTVCSDCNCQIFRPHTHRILNHLWHSDPIAGGESDLGEHPGGTPHVVAPIEVLSSGLRDLFSRPAMVPAVEEWKSRHKVRGELRSMQDATVWNTIKGPDGKLFFYEGDCDKEIRLGVTFSLDWFGRKTSNYGPSHSSGVMSFCLQNLSTSLRYDFACMSELLSTEYPRYRAENLILSGMPPGPTEPTSSQLQNYVKKHVDDLIMLHDEGIVIRPPEHPNGIRLRVALVGISADHPAMCKLCGFADHSHNEAPCTKCKVPRHEMFTNKSLRNGKIPLLGELAPSNFETAEYAPRTGEEHRKLCFEYKRLNTPEEKDAFFATHGLWESGVLLRLNLGVAKTQWYTRWIKTNTLRADTAKQERELRFVHDFLETYESPLWAGRLPLRVGEPAGGSLTADEYKFAVTGPWAIIIPVVWDQFCGDAQEGFKRSSERYEIKKAEWVDAMAEWKRKQGKVRSKAAATDPPPEPKKPTLRMQAGEDENFLRFATALKILVGSSIRIEALPRAKSLLRDYLVGFSTLYGADQMKPNHHWAVHIMDQISDYGPVYTFWAFLTERLNKVLKNLNSNNWTGGRLEVSMMREFHRSAGLDGVMESIINDVTSDNLERTFVERLLSAGKTQALGTIQDAARGGTSMRAEPGRVAKQAERLNDMIRFGLLQYYNRDKPQVHFLRQESQNIELAETSPLHSYAETYIFALLDGRRIVPTTSQRTSDGSSIIQARFGDEAHAGEIRNIFIHRQQGVDGSQSTLLAAVEWMKESDYTPLDNAGLWNKL